MRTEAICRERSEEGSSQIDALRNDLDRSGDVPHAEADLATLTAFQRFVEALAPRRGQREPGSQLGTDRRREERIGIARARQGIIETKSPPDGPVQARRELGGPRDDDREVAAERCHQEQGFDRTALG